MQGSRLKFLAAIAAFLAMGLPSAALADFPYPALGPGDDYTDLHLNNAQVPNDLGGEEYKYAATPEDGNANGLNDLKATELGGVRGAHVVDDAPTSETAWELSTGRPDVTIAVHDSGIRWDDAGAMNDIRFKTRLSKGEVPRPQGACNPPGGGDPYDCNADGVFNLADYLNDPRVLSVLNGGLSSPRVGPANMMTPQDVLIAFSDPGFSGDGKAGGVDDDGNGYVDDIVGWDFFDNDNDPFDDVAYGHGTGESRDSTAEANSGAGRAGSCPNCMVIHNRVGDSFIADVNRFAAGVTYSTDNDVQVVQSALGTLNGSTLARKAVDYAYRHGVTSVVSAADEAAQHNNQPSLPHTILVNSVTEQPTESGGVPPNKSYTTFNGCTNFNSKITIAIPSNSCSSEAVGIASGLAGLIYSAARNARAQGKLQSHPDAGACETVDGDPCVITPNEVRQLMASGRIDADADSAIEVGERQVDDINFLSPGLTPSPADDTPEAACAPAPAPGCTGPYGAANAFRALFNANRPVLGAPVALESYPARAGHDQFYGYGRVNIRKGVEAILPSSGNATLPPEAELHSPEWYEQLDPNQDFAVEGDVYARGNPYTCQVLVAPGQYPNERRTTDSPPGDFLPLTNGWCDGTTVRSGAAAQSMHSGALSTVNAAQLRGAVPARHRLLRAGARAEPPEHQRPPRPRSAFVHLQGRRQHGYGVGAGTGPRMSGEDQRAAFLHRDADMLDGFPRTVADPEPDGAPGYPGGDGESSPAFADLDGDNRNELIYATSDGFVHALSRNPQTADVSELPGWPVQGDRPGFVDDHVGAPGYASGEVPPDLGAGILASVAVADADRDGIPEVYGADYDGKVYGWRPDGDRVFTEESNPAFSGTPLVPFENVRKGETNRTQHGFIGSPVLADIAGNADLELIAASMDRHVYAWRTDDSNPGAPGGAGAVDGYPELVVDRDKVDTINPTTHRIQFKADAGSNQQGGLIDTPAVGDIDPAHPGPEIVVGTNEAYADNPDTPVAEEPPPNTSVLSNPSFAVAANTGLVVPGNTRLYALDSRGDQDGNPATPDAELAGWPVPLAFLLGNLLPVVGEGVTGPPVIGPATCSSGGAGSKIGAVSYAGPAYILNPNGSSCYGEAGGTDVTLATDQGASTDAVDRPIIPAVGGPAFGQLTAGAGDPSFLTPAAGLLRALDLALPENQPTGQDYIAAWDTSTGQFRPNFPQTQNDLSFLTGPSIADIDGLPGEEVLSGSASLDLNAYNAAGLAVPGWPKLTTDWTIANPLIGSFGTLDTDSAAQKVVIGMTRSGYLNAYATAAPACSPGSWPRFHHDNANSGDYSRDAVLPGKPLDLATASGNITLQGSGRRPALRHRGRSTSCAPRTRRSTSPTSTLRRRSPARRRPRSPPARRRASPSRRPPSATSRSAGSTIRTTSAASLRWT